MSKKDMDKIVKEVKDRLGVVTPAERKCHRCGWIMLGVGVLVALLGLILYIKSKEDDDIEEYYEYFDEDLDDDDMYDDADEDVEYLEIKNFEDEDSTEESV
ncbi:MAG: hypothetical protein BEN19_05835 [Epulopiscium sp. Nuni2H_MBin003]|nr:MAG: hypothetical protein BEN19_05835 [Epulopiscium sp. Nuni2H_MBin003]